jgi:hypothetical protein
VEAVPFLVRKIEWTVVGFRFDYVEDRYSGKPALQALIRIGLPSVTGILKNDEIKGATPEALARFAIVIREVFPDAKTARAFVDAYDPGYTPEARAKLDELKKELAKLP